jgi:hypothetical protein
LLSDLGRSDLALLDQASELLEQVVASQLAASTGA